VRKGRRGEFAAFEWKGEIPDPQAKSTFLNSKINIQLGQLGQHKILLDIYRELISLRKEMPALCNLLKENMEVKEIGKNILCVRRWFAEDDIFCIYNFSARRRDVSLIPPPGTFMKILDSSSRKWKGRGEVAAALIKTDGSEIEVPLRPFSFVVYKIRSFKEE
jgi:maltooligosyltrehalose trehalohydrolase